MSGNACDDMGNGGHKRQVGLDVMAAKTDASLI